MQIVFDIGRFELRVFIEIVNDVRNCHIIAVVCQSDTFMCRYNLHLTRNKQMTKFVMHE